MSCYGKTLMGPAFVTTTVLNAPRIAVMPIIFTADFLARSSFDISAEAEISA